MDERRRIYIPSLARHLHRIHVGIQTTVRVRVIVVVVWLCAVENDGPLEDDGYGPGALCHGVVIAFYA